MYIYAYINSYINNILENVRGKSMVHPSILDIAFRLIETS